MPDDRFGERFVARLTGARDEGIAQRAAAQLGSAYKPVRVDWLAG